MMSGGFTAFAPIYKGKYLILDYTRRQAGDVRRDFGRIYHQPTLDAGWKMALKEGYRVVRVIVTIAPTETGAA